MFSKGRTQSTSHTKYKYILSHYDSLPEATFTLWQSTIATHFLIGWSSLVLVGQMVNLMTS